MADLEDIFRRQGKYYDSLLANFEEQLRAITSKAQARLVSYLQKNLAIEDGRILRSSRNLREIRTLDARFLYFLKESGYDTLLDSFTLQFAKQARFLDDTIAALGAALKTPFPPVVFSSDETSLLASLKLNAQSSIEAVAAAAARTAMQQAAFSVGGMKFGDLVEALAEKLEQSIPRARTIAETAATSFYRTMTDLTFQKIERSLPQQQHKYKYSGPEDQKTRPFCERLLLAGTPWTREQIEAMDNGQLPNVFISCGGFNCRHIWLLDISSLVALKRSA